MCNKVEANEFYAARLVRDYWLPRNYSCSGSLFSSKFWQEFRRLLCIRTNSLMVAGRHVHGGYHLCSLHSSPCRWPGLHARSSGELDLVGFFAVRDDDCVPF